MATAAQIKSAIRSQSTGQRKMMSSLADVGSSLMSAKESSMMFDLKQRTYYKKKSEEKREKKNMQSLMHSLILV